MNINLNELEPCVRIGKKGVTEESIQEIKKLLKKRKIIKIKLLKAAIEEKDKHLLFDEIGEKTEAEILEKKGFTLVLKIKE